MLRRSVLKGACAISAAVVGAGVWRASETGVFGVGKGPAFAPWHDWQNSNGGPIALIRAAILGASAHNIQPWLFKVSDVAIEFYADTDRNSGALDPYLREQHLGLGCALENLMLAAQANGYSASATVSSGKLTGAAFAPKRQLVARIELSPGNALRGELYDAIPRRHTNRGPYQPNAMPAEFINEIELLIREEPDINIFLFDAPTDRRHIAEMISKAGDVVYADPLVDQGSSKWVRQTWDDIQIKRDGLTKDESGKSPLVAAAEKFLAPTLTRFAHRHALLRGVPYIDVLNATPLFGIIAVRDRYDMQQNLRAGRLWQRAHLLATARGIAARPVSEALELVEQERLHAREPQGAAALSTLIGDGGWQPTLMFRLGYPRHEYAPSPRRSVEAVLV